MLKINQEIERSRSDNTIQREVDFKPLYVHLRLINNELAGKKLVMQNFRLFITTASYCSFDFFGTIQTR